MRYDIFNISRNAIIDWLPEFFMEKAAWGPISKPQPPLTSKYLCNK